LNYRPLAILVLRIIDKVSNTPKDPENLTYEPP